MDPNPESSTSLAATPASRIGLALFAVYLLFYGGFIAAAAFSPRLMAATPFGGMNLATLYGFALIVGALVLACAYMVLCRRAERKARSDRTVAP